MEELCAPPTSQQSWSARQWISESVLITAWSHIITNLYFRTLRVPPKHFLKRCRLASFSSSQNDHHHKMGAIVCVAADNSAAEKETILNTRANKIREMRDRVNSRQNRFNRHSDQYEANFQLQDDTSQLHSVGFGTLVHERHYLSQDSPSAPVFRDVVSILTTKPRRCCNWLCSCGRPADGKAEGKFNKRKNRFQQGDLATWKLFDVMKSRVRKEDVS